MISKTATTFELDDLTSAVEELQAQLADFTYMKNSVGIVFTYSDADVNELAELLQSRFDFPIIGCTAVASMDGEHAFHDMATSLMVLSADDCEFSLAVSEDITAENVQEQIRASYAALMQGHTEAPGLVIALPPYELEIMLDEYTNAFNEIAPGIPFVGGLPSYNANGDVTYTIAEGKAYDKRMPLIAIFGNIKPVFAVLNVATEPVDRKRKATKTKSNVIYEAGGQPFVDYLKDIGLPVEDIVRGIGSVSYVANPLLVEHEENGEVFRYLRALHLLDLEDGSGTAIGRIPQGAIVSVCPLDRDEIGAAADKGAAELSAQMAAQADYTYSTVLAVSCIGRYVVLTPESGEEADRLLKGLPEGISLCGFYSNGEIGPYAGKKQTLTFAHNESMVLCAF